MRQEAILKRSERVLPPPRMQKAAECGSHTNKEKSLDILQNHGVSSACQGTEVTWQWSSLNWKGGEDADWLTCARAGEGEGGPVAEAS